VRILIRPRLPVLALLLFTPTIPELLTGSTPISELVYNPPGFVIGYLLDVALYGGGALLIREFAVQYRKGWASILLLGAAYGIAEEGFEVHTFFLPSGPPVNAFATYGHAFGVNWLWALGLASFHATYSIALPILLTQLWFPAVKNVRWLDRGSLGLVAGLFLLEVVGFGLIVPHGPSPAVAAFFLGVAATLIALAWWAPANLLAPRPGPARLGRLGLGLAGTLFWLAWLILLFFAALHSPPAIVAAAFFVLVNLGTLALLLRTVGTVDLERSKYYFATGMLLALLPWDIIIEFAVPGILVVLAVVLYFQYRLGQRLAARSIGSSVPAGVVSPPAT